jgi:hypothetical protein
MGEAQKIDTDGVRRIAAQWHARGCNVIPVAQKRALGQWKHWQTRRQPRDVLVTWLTRQSSLTGYAIICGAVSGNLVVLDFDDWPTFARCWKAHEWIRTTYTVKTGRGWHVYLRVDDLPASTTIHAHGGSIEVRANGNYVVGPGSYHESGKRYIPRDSKAPIAHLANLDDLIQNAKQSAATSAIKNGPLSETPMPVGVGGNLTKGDHQNRNPRLHQEIVGTLGRTWQKRGRWINGPCLFPHLHDEGQDKHPSGGYNLDDGSYNCFACGWHSQKEVATALGLDAASGWVLPKQDGNGAGTVKDARPKTDQTALHPNLARKYPDRNAAPLVLLVNAWLTSGGSCLTDVKELCDFAQDRKWDYSPKRLRYLVRTYGEQMGLYREGHTLVLPSLRQLATRCGLDKLGPVATVDPDAPTTLDPASRGGAARLRTALFDADRRGKETGANWRATQLGYKSRTTTYRHAKQASTEIVPGDVILMHPSVAATSDRHPFAWWARRPDGLARSFPTDDDNPRHPPQALLEWLGEGEALHLLAVAQAASVYLPAFVFKMCGKCNPGTEVQYEGGKQDSAHQASDSLIPAHLLEKWARENEKLRELGERIGARYRSAGQPYELARLGEARRAFCKRFPASSRGVAPWLADRRDKYHLDRHFRPRAAT